MAAVLKSAVIGTGMISKQHLSFLQTCDRANVVGVFDLSPAAAGYAVETFQSENSSISAYTDYAQMLEIEKPDVVHILTPPQIHLPMQQTACERALM